MVRFTLVELSQLERISDLPLICPLWTSEASTPCIYSLFQLPFLQNIEIGTVALLNCIDELNLFRMPLKCNWRLYLNDNENIIVVFMNFLWKIKSRLQYCGKICSYFHVWNLYIFTFYILIVSCVWERDCLSYSCTVIRFIPHSAALFNYAIVLSVSL